MVSLDAWLRRYEFIARTMGYDVNMDKEATKTLADLLKGVQPPIGVIEGLISRKPVIIFGAGPSLDENLDGLVARDRDFHERFTLIAANGATQALVERNITPHIVVTDLDGDVASLIGAAKNGSVMVIHGHGDNIDKLIKHVSGLLGVTDRVLGTTQVEPIPPLYNFGGFTDGDRAVFLAANFNPHFIAMMGMDFGEVVGRRSKPWLRRDVLAWGDKVNKLRIAYELISWLASTRAVEVYTLSREAPPGVRRISLDELLEMVRRS